jgi:predicted SAM-dependent methyltransferase
MPGSSSLKLNLGCGYLPLEGYVNVDNDPNARADMWFDLEDVWPIQDDSVTEIVMHHVMEHLGETYRSFIAVMQELYRVSQHGCVWKITVPHPDSDTFSTDPTHVRRVTPAMLKMFDQADNVQDIVNHGHYTKLGLMHGIDIEVIHETTTPMQHWAKRLESGQSTWEDLDFAAIHWRNVAQEIYMECRTHKPARYDADVIKRYHG